MLILGGTFTAYSGFKRYIKFREGQHSGGHRLSISIEYFHSIFPLFQPLLLHTSFSDCLFRIRLQIMDDFPNLRIYDQESVIDRDEHQEMSISVLENASDDSFSGKNWLTAMQWRENLDGDIGNRGMSDDLPEFFVKSLTVRADDFYVATYREGREVKLDTTAPVIDVAVCFVPGADKAQINMMENNELNKEEPKPKSSRWLTLTAGNTLLELDVQNDLTIIPIDQTPSIIEKLRMGTNASSLLPWTKPDSNASTVTIDSRRVTLINDFSERKPVHLESTCIEVDAISIYELITNFRTLIKKEGRHTPSGQEDDDPRTLECMIEDARRLFVRSPILQRVSQRLIIQKSRNTRYGVDTGKMFHTLTTSRGIAGLIRQGAAHYSSLSSVGEARSKVRGRFMQMVVFLLSLLNDTDLASLRDTLEKSYEFKADRQSVELAILKVLPLEAVGPYTFLTGTLSTFYGHRVEVENSEKKKSKAWDDFVADITQAGWLLPGPGPLCGRDTGSWSLKWRQRDNSDIFDHLQYEGELNAVNFIPPLKVHSKALASQEVSAELRNGQLYRLSAKDLDGITLGTPKTYTVFHSVTGEKSDIIVKQWAIFPELDDASEKLEAMCLLANKYSSTLAMKAAKRRNRLSRTVNKKTDKLPYFAVRQTHGVRTTGVTTIISHQTQREENISVAWMLNKRKITFEDLMRGISSDLNLLNSLHKSLKEFTETHAADLSEDYLHRDMAFKELDDVERLLLRVDEKRRKMQAPKKPDEPITRVHFQTTLVQAKPANWFAYQQKFPADSSGRNGRIPMTSELSIKSERYELQDKPVWREDESTIKIELENGHVLSVWPIFDPLDTKTFRPADFAKRFPDGVSVLLFGAVAAIAKPFRNGFKVIGFLKITDVVRAEQESSYWGGDDPEESVEETILV